jgi:hypothetical protein
MKLPWYMKSRHCTKSRIEIVVPWYGVVIILIKRIWDGQRK